MIRSIDYFNDIFDKAVPFILENTTSYELNSTMIHELIEKYWRSKRGTRRDQGYFLRELNKLQCKIESDLLDKLSRYAIHDDYNDNYVYIINSQNYEQFMQEVYPYLNKIEGVHTSIIGIVNENKLNWSGYYTRADYQKDLGGFYNEYWDVLLDIRNKSIEIDKKMRTYKQSLLTSLLDSPASRRWIYLTICLIFIFGLLIPFYMIQPNKLGLLPCHYVFYVVVISLLASIASPYIAYLNRHKYETVARDVSA